MPYEESKFGGAFERFVKWCDFGWMERRGVVNVANVKVLPVSISNEGGVIN